MKVGDLIKGKSDTSALLSWDEKELGVITGIDPHGEAQDVTVVFQDGGSILLEMTALKSLFEVISEAP
tara:strand:+ start:202 stop:405 length:204 start_codon:yes stop_codon:yes gene_type:complete